MSLRHRVKKLEGGYGGVGVVIVRRELSEAERGKAAKDYRRVHGLPPNAPVLVVSGTDAKA